MGSDRETDVEAGRRNPDHEHRRGRGESDLATIDALDDKKPTLRESENQPHRLGQMQVPDSRGPANRIVTGFGIIISRIIIPRVPRR